MTYDVYILVVDSYLYIYYFIKIYIYYYNMLITVYLISLYTNSAPVAYMP